MDELKKLLENAGVREETSALARYDEFSIEVDNHWIHLLDGEGTIRVTMPQDVWDGLISSYAKGKNLRHTENVGINPQGAEIIGEGYNVDDPAFQFGMAQLVKYFVRFVSNHVSNRNEFETENDIVEISKILVSKARREFK